MGRHLPNIINYSLRTILDMFQTSFSTVAQLFVILRLLGTQDNSFTLILLCLAQPLLTPFIKNDLWGQSMYSPLESHTHAPTADRDRYRCHLLRQQLEVPKNPYHV